MKPEKDGMASLNDVRHDEILKLKPFVFLTAKHNEIDLVNAFGLGVDDYLKKSFSEKELIHRLNAVYANYKERIEFSKKDKLTINEDLVIEDSPSDFIFNLQKTILTHIQSHEFGLEFLAEKTETSKKSLIKNGEEGNWTYTK